jgi:aminomethyltransferase
MSASAEAAVESDEVAALLHTPLHAWHLAQGARMGAFAGYDMPIRYELGTIAEHHHTRTSASLFDVSHMGVAELHADDDTFHTVAEALELFVPCDVDLLPPGRQRYTQMLNAKGGIIDDLMISRTRDRPNMLTIVSNAGRKAIVFEHLRQHLPEGARLVQRPEVSLVALQGPLAETALLRVATTDGDTLTAMRFMDVSTVHLAGVQVAISRSGYSGEDGFEIATPADDVLQVVTALAAQPEVKPAGLGARDTLRLEAGLCLYGNDIDETTSPIEAGLAWSIQKRRRSDLGFPGATRIAAELSDGAAQRLVGLSPVGKAPVREHAPLYADPTSDRVIGHVTSGGFSPTLGRPIACGYVDPDVVDNDEGIIYAEVRGNRLAVAITSLPFVPHTYKR